MKPSGSSRVPAISRSGRRTGSSPRHEKENESIRITQPPRICGAVSTPNIRRSDSLLVEAGALFQPRYSFLEFLNINIIRHL